MQTPRTDPAGSDPATRSDVKARKASPLQGDYGETDVLLTTPVHGFVVERKEMVRVMIQSLRDMGFEKSAESLERESGVAEQHPCVDRIEALIQSGKWSEASRMTREALAETHACKPYVVRACTLLLAQEEYHELLLRDAFVDALSCLQHELAPLCGRQDTAKHASLLLCDDTEALRVRLRRSQGDDTEHRKRVWERLRTLLPQSLALPRQRLLTLLDHSLVEQTRRCFRKRACIQPGQSNVKLSLVQDVSDLVEDLHRLPARVVQRIAAHGESAQIWCVAFNQQGTRVACTGTDKRVRVFDVGSVAGDVKLSPWASLSGEAATCLAWSPCGRLLAAGDEDGRIYIWDGLGGDKSSPKPSPALVLRNLSKRVVRIWWKPSSRRGCEQVIAGSLDGALVLFEARTGAILACWSGAPVYDFVYSSRKRLIVAACGSCDKTSNMIGSCDPVKAASRSQHRFMRVFAVDESESSKESTARETTETEEPAAVRTSLSSSTFSSSSSSSSSSLSSSSSSPSVDAPLPRRQRGTKQLVELSDKCKADRFMSDEQIVSMVLSSDEERLFTTIVGGNIVEWCMRTGLWQASYKGAHHGSAVIRSSLGGFCESLIATGTTDGSICIWEREAGEAGESNEADSGAVEPVLMLGEHTQPVNAVTWSPTDPSVLVSVSDDGQLLVWTGKPGQTED